MQRGIAAENCGEKVYCEKIVCFDHYHSDYSFTALLHASVHAGFTIQ